MSDMKMATTGQKLVPRYGAQKQVENLSYLIASAHHAVLGHDGHDVAVIDEIIERLTKAKAAHEAGDMVAASAQFDTSYVVKAVS